MSFFLDTHTVLWLLRNDPQLSPVARAIAEESKHQLLFSLASLWEIAIKVRRGRLDLRCTMKEFVEQIGETGLRIRMLQTEHVCLVATMPLHHGDPFDRILAAQSLLDQIPLVSRDVMFDAYGVDRIW